MFAAERSTFEGQLAGSWTSTPIAYDNVAFTPGVVPFIRVTVIGGNSTQETLGKYQWHRREGFCIIQCFTPSGTGTAFISGVADSLCNLFRSKQFSGITCGSPSPQRMGDDGRGWFQINVVIPFFNEALKEI